MDEGGVLDEILRDSGRVTRGGRGGGSSGLTPYFNLWAPCPDRLESRSIEKSNLRRSRVLT